MRTRIKREKKKGRRGKGRKSEEGGRRGKKKKRRRERREREEKRKGRLSSTKTLFSKKEKEMIKNFWKNKRNVYLCTQTSTNEAGKELNQRIS